MSECTKTPLQQPPPYEMHVPQPPTVVQPLPHQPPTVVQPTVLQPITQIVVPRVMGPNSTQTVCPSCNNNIMSSVKYEPSGKTHVSALLLCILCLPCVCLPYLIDSCQAANHYCPSCGAFLGSYDN